jgi:hypothetical protein
MDGGGESERWKEKWFFNSIRYFLDKGTKFQLSITIFYKKSCEENS